MDVDALDECWRHLYVDRAHLLTRDAMLAQIRCKALYLVGILAKGNDCDPPHLHVGNQRQMLMVVTVQRFINRHGRHIRQVGPSQCQLYIPTDGMFSML